jgi:hypothetical protein
LTQGWANERQRYLGFAFIDGKQKGNNSLPGIFLEHTGKKVSYGIERLAQDRTRVAGHHGVFMIAVEKTDGLALDMPLTPSSAVEKGVLLEFQAWWWRIEASGQCFLYPAYFELSFLRGADNAQRTTATDIGMAATVLVP